MITYTMSTADIHPSHLTGFFVGWPNPPSPERHLAILNAASHVVLAIDDQSGRVVGFIYAISDNILSAYIPLLEVLPEYKNQGIGRELVRRLLDQLKDFYMIDLICDDNLRPFYEKLGLKYHGGMIIRNYNRQSGS
ncbi:MAG: GNAT family N-acetyltransferase [candidate division Zixibacteria bacterium]|nr:GNAT family N-acetyltransferase [candidate division Zixibacteria bacterium]